MFERGKAIREAKKAEMLAKERRRIKAEIERNGITVTPEVEAILSGEVPRTD